MTLPLLPDLDAALDVGHALTVHPWVDSLVADPRPEARLVAVRALRQLGADRGSDALALRLGRQTPGHAGARLAWLRVVVARNLHAGWQALRRYPLDKGAPAGEQAERLSLEGLWLAMLHDDAAALALQRRALDLAPENPWLWVEHSYALTQGDRYEDALQAASRALALAPGYRTGVLQAARLLQLLHRGAEARALLEPVLAETGNAAFAWQLFALADEDQRHDDALALLDAIERGQPRAEPSALGQLAARRADVLLALGRLDEAREQAASVPGTGFYSRLAERLAAASEAVPRVLLPMAMVRQHWMTCAPATLTALARWWGRGADHVEVAQAICYDGTPQASERAWAEAQGFVVRECRLDLPTAHALIDAGVPFALATQEVGGGHLQAVVGYDRLRGTLLIRDPSLALHAEYEAETLLQQQQSNGPRALVLVPPEHRARLDGIVLPEAAAWDQGHALLAALQRHDRPAALTALQRLETDHPDSDRTLHARRHLALYDGDEPRILAATEALLARYPDDRNLQLSRLSSLSEVRGEAAADAWLDELVARQHPDARLLVRQAARLNRDARRAALAEAAAVRALRREPTCGPAWTELGVVRWARLGVAASLEPLRWASTLQPTDERAAAAYARACRIGGQAAVGLDWLRERVRVWGDRSGQPAVTLADELDFWQLDADSTRVLNEALAKRPAEGALRLAVAERALRSGRLDEAQLHLDAAAEAHAPSRLRVQSQLHEARGEVDAALGAAREAVALEPLNLGHHRLLLRLLRRCLGPEQALATWRPLADAHPAHFGLQQLLYEVLPDAPEAIDAQLAHLHAHHPSVTWLQRERAVQASRRGHHDEAVALAQAALALAPEQSVSHGVLAFCIVQRDGWDAAQPAMRAALERDAENETALLRWLDAPDVARRCAAFEFVAAQMRQQVLLGDGLLMLQSAAPHGVPGEAVLELLDELRQRWPALWQGPVAQALQLLHLQRPDEALALLGEAAARFPALPRVHVEHARALCAAGRIDEAIASNERAIALSPSWNTALRLHVELLCDHRADHAAAEALLRRALQSREAWDDADLAGLLAWVLEQQRRPEDALEAAERSLRLAPAADWVWAIAHRVCTSAERPAAFDLLVEDIVARCPGDAAAWRVRAQNDRDDTRALAAAERAIELQPRNEAAWIARFERLQRLRRGGEIVALLAQLPWPEPAPVALRAWAPRIDWAEGRRAAAVSALAALCAEAPHDESLCRLLADWHDETGNHDGYLRQARVLMELAPQMARSHAYLGHALLKSGRAAEALAPLLRATELMPGFVFAVRQLTQAARDAGQPSRAAHALEALWPRVHDVATACDGAELAAAAGDADGALAWLERLGDTRDEFDVERSLAALAACRAAGWQTQVRRWQDAHVARGAGPAGVADDWLRRRARIAEVWAFIGALRLLGAAEGPHLAVALLRRLGDRQARLSLLLLLLLHGDALRRHPMSWGETSYALARLGLWRPVARWLRDWRERERPPSYALANLTHALVVLGRWGELRQVVQHTLQRQPYHEDMRLWQLLLLAQDSALEELEGALARTHEWEPDPWMRQPLQALQAFLALARARGAGGTVAALRRAGDGGGVPQGRVLCRELRRLARRSHTPWTRLHLWLAPAL